MNIKRGVLCGCVIAMLAGTPVYATTPDCVVVDTEEDIAEEVYQDELQMLAILVMAEAGNQDLKGKRLVVDVVLNRVDDPRWPDNIKDVIYQPYQFSPIKDGGFERAAYTVTDECFEAVRLELEERLDSNIHYFCAGGYSQYGECAYQYGDHYFSN